MIGIYKITNLKNGKMYIGQSRQIEKRFQQHKNQSKFLEEEKWYNPLYLDMHSIGIDNFSFEVVEECTIEELNEKEEYWIKYYNSQENGYNITSGGDCTGKLSSNEVNEIIKLLKDKKLSIIEIANIYNVSESTIYLINNGCEFFNKEMTYPIRNRKDNIRISIKNGNTVIKNKNYSNGVYVCPICGKNISANSSMCIECNGIKQRKVKDRPSKEELLELIKRKSFLEIGRMYGVSDNAIRKWCKIYNLPYRKKDIEKML